jgi:hypothetical protein
MYQAMAANLATCQSQDDIEMFAREYPDVVERTTTTGTSVSTGPSASVGPATLTIEGGHGTESTEKRDGAGRLIGTEDTGTRVSGATLDIAGVKGGGKNTDTAAAKTDEQGRAQLDLQRKNEQNSMVDSFVAAAKGVAQRLRPTSLGDATGGNAPEAETQVTIAGVTLNDDDLGRIGELAVRKDKRWRSAFLLPSDSGDWEAARAAIVAGDGTPAAVGKALSDFLGSSDRGRLQGMVQFLRPGGSVGDGKRAELPDELKDRAAQYQRAVLDEPQEQLEFIAASTATRRCTRRATRSSRTWTSSSRRSAPARPSAARRRAARCSPRSGARGCSCRWCWAACSRLRTAARPSTRR